MIKILEKENDHGFVTKQRERGSRMRTYLKTSTLEKFNLKSILGKK